jgi:hypothetical protein
MTLHDLLDPIYDPCDADSHPADLTDRDVRDLDACPVLAPIGRGLLREESDAGR